METRRPHSTKFSELPKDYIQMVDQVFATNFDSGLKALGKIRKGKTRFMTSGRIYTEEVVLSVSVVFEGQLAATTVFASVDYDAKASSPTIQDLLAACVDGVGVVYGQLFGDGKAAKIEAIADQSLSAMKEVPFHWTELKVDRYRVYMKVDKSNPTLDAIAENWLERHDPEIQSSREKEAKETEELFVTGPKKKH